MIGLIVIAVALGAENLAASAALGLAGASRRTKWRVGIVFGLFEGAMPVVGATVGHGLASKLGSTAHIAGGLLLVAIGLYQAFEAGREDKEKEQAFDAAGTGRLLLTGFALSIDNLVAGLSLGALPVSLAVVGLVIGLVSGSMSVLGLEIGRRIGERVTTNAERAGGIVLAAMGIALAAGWIG